jgi:transcriptional regulator with PAS, ATPase and Fis domain
LLRVLQEKVFEPLGATEPVKSEARIIAATNRDLEQMVESGEFRQDLFYRINVVPITLPPLRERQNDIPLLIDHFIEHFNRIQCRSIERVSSDALGVLLDYQYPGNIRELENIIQHAFVLCQGYVIEKKHLPAYLFRPSKKISTNDISCSLEEIDKRRIEESLSRNKYNRVNTAKELGIHVTTLWRKMKKYGINI